MKRIKKELIIGFIVGFILGGGASYAAMTLKTLLVDSTGVAVGTVANPVYITTN